MNFVVQLARLTAKPEVKTSAGGTAYTIFSIAQDKYKEGTNFFTCKAFGKTAEFLGTWGDKGKRFLFSGELDQETWEKEGTKHSRVVIIVNRAEFADGKGEATGCTSAEVPKGDSDGFVDIPDGIDEELPFK